MEDLASRLLPCFGPGFPVRNLTNMKSDSKETSQGTEERCAQKILAIDARFPASTKCGRTWPCSNMFNKQQSTKMHYNANQSATSLPKRASSSRGPGSDCTMYVSKIVQPFVCVKWADGAADWFCWKQ